MRIFSKRTLQRFWRRHPDAENALNDWYDQVSEDRWHSPADLLRRYRRASIVGSDRAVFRIRGNRYRLVARVNYRVGHVYIRFIGTHSEYDRIDAEEV